MRLLPFHDMKPSPVRWLEAGLRRLGRVLHGSVWFPHVPLAILFGVGGILLLRRDLGADGSGFLADLLTGIPHFQPGLLPQLLIGIGMLIMALGLVFRSRVAWVMALLLAATAVASLVVGRHRGGFLLLSYFILVLGSLLAAGRDFNR